MPENGFSIWNPCHFPDDPFDYLALAQAGLPRSRQPRTVIIVGAGAAGLTAAYELLRAGHEPLLIEASQRVGGRLYTMREAFSAGLYGEAGSMRIPEAHRTTLFYARQRFGLQTRPFPNVDVDDRGFYFLGGERISCRQIKDDPAFVANRVRRRWDATFAPIRRRMDRAAAQGRIHAEWQELVAEYRDWSLRDFLVRGPHPWPAEELRHFGQVGLGIGGYDSMLGLAFVELMRLFYCGWDQDQVEIVGGCDQLAERFLTTPPPGCAGNLAQRIGFGAEVVRIEQSEAGVRVGWRGQAGSGESCGDYLILTAPFPVLATTVEVDPPFSAGKRRAIQNLHYLSAAKVFLQSRARFWEPSSPGAVPAAGTTITDLALRAAYFPLEPFAGTERSLILASYTWEEDAERWCSLAPEERVSVAARQLGEIFPSFRDQCEGGVSIAWHQEPFARGAFAQFTPGQMEMYEDIIRPEGRIHIAGEHASFAHGWVEGAVQSGLRAALQIAEEAAAG